MVLLVKVKFQILNWCFSALPDTKIIPDDAKCTTALLFCFGHGPHVLITKQGIKFSFPGFPPYQRDTPRLR